MTANGKLVGYWSFDDADGVNDLSGNGHDGDIHGNPLVVEGKTGQALEFNGTSNYVVIQHHVAISELDALSLSALIQPKKFGSWIAVVDEVALWNEVVLVEESMDPLSVKPRNKLRICKVFGINRIIHRRRELRFPIGRDAEIAPTGFLNIFCQKLYTPTNSQLLGQHKNTILIYGITFRYIHREWLSCCV